MLKTLYFNVYQKSNYPKIKLLQVEQRLHSLQMYPWSIEKNSHSEDAILGMDYQMTSSTA